MLLEGLFCHIRSKERFCKKFSNSSIVVPLLPRQARGTLSKTHTKPLLQANASVCTIVNQTQPTDHGQERGDGGLRGEGGVLQDRLGTRLDGGDGETGRAVLGVDRLQRLVQPTYLGEDVLRRWRRVGIWTVWDDVSV